MTRPSWLARYARWATHGCLNGGGLPVSGRKGTPCGLPSKRRCRRSNFRGASVAETDTQRLSELRRKLIRVPRKPGNAALGESGTWLADCSAAAQWEHGMAAEVAVAAAP